MKNKKVFFSIFLTAIVLSIVSFTYLDQRPVRFFFLKAHANRVEAFRIDVYLNQHLSTLTPLSLNNSQQFKSAQILSAKNLYQLQSLASSFGIFDFLIGSTQSDQEIDSFWNNFLRRETSADGFDNLNETDRIYFKLMAKRELSAQNSREAAINSIPISTTGFIAPTVLVPAKKALFAPIVRVEILNGCGIKGASEWVVSRVASQTISAKNGGNAANFNYPDSQIVCSTAASPDLIKVLTVLGFTKLKQISSKTLPAGYDAVLIVGKDFQTIKGN